MTAGIWPPEGLLPPLPVDAYPPGAIALPAELTKPLVELRPGFSTLHRDTVAIGFDEAMTVAHERASQRGYRQVVTRCYSDETRLATPSLARFWCIQDWR